MHDTISMWIDCDISCLPPSRLTWGSGPSHVHHNATLDNDHNDAGSDDNNMSSRKRSHPDVKYRL